MRSRIRQSVVALAFVLAIAPAMADNLEGSDAFLCTAVEVTACYTDGECITVPPWSLDVPQFIETLYEKRFGRDRPDKICTIEEHARERARKARARREAKAARRLARKAGAEIPDVDVQGAATAE